MEFSLLLKIPKRHKLFPFPSSLYSGLPFGLFEIWNGTTVSPFWGFFNVKEKVAFMPVLIKSEQSFQELNEFPEKSFLFQIFLLNLALFIFDDLVFLKLLVANISLLFFSNLATLTLLAFWRKKLSILNHSSPKRRKKTCHSPNHSLMLTNFFVS